MAKLKLSYFDIHGGRGEAARLALSIGGIAFDDDRIPPPEWPRRKPSTPFGALPTLEIEGQLVSQSNSINRYIGKLADLYPTDPLQALYCDEAMDAVEDVDTKIGTTFALSDEEKKVVREKLVAGPIPVFLTGLQRLLEQRGGTYFAGNRLTVADLKAFVSIRRLRSGKIDHIPADLVDRIAPKLAAHSDRIKQHPGVQAYYAKHGTTP